MADDYCSAEFHDEQIPLELAIATAIRENPANRKTIPGSDPHALAAKVSLGQDLSDDERAMMPNLALLINRLWSPGRHVTVTFMEGSAVQQAKVQRWVQGWSMASVRFEFPSDPAVVGMIRLKFDPTDSNWSVLGTNCLTIAHDQPTMNLAAVTDTSDDDTDRRKVLHEFGHALGCVHEHERSDSGIQWNKPVVYAELGGPPNNWTPAEVDKNVFNQVSVGQTDHSIYDPLSIMMYFFPPTWTTNGFSVPVASDLSADDKAYMQQVYPFQQFENFENGIAFVSDSTSMFMLSVSKGLDRRRRIDGIWQRFEYDFLNDQGGADHLSERAAGAGRFCHRVRHQGYPGRICN